LQCLETKITKETPNENAMKEEDQSKMEENRVVVMEVEHATHRGGKAKPSSRMSVWCRHLHKQDKVRVFHSLGGGLAHRKCG